MEHTKQILPLLFILSMLHYATSSYFGDPFTHQIDESSRIGWLFSDISLTAKKTQKALLELRREIEDDSSLKILNGKCRDKLNYLYGDIDRNNDEFVLLECIQTFKVFIIFKKALV